MCLEICQLHSTLKPASELCKISTKLSQRCGPSSCMLFVLFSEQRWPVLSYHPVFRCVCVYWMAGWPLCLQGDNSPVMWFTSPVISPFNFRTRGGRTIKRLLQHSFISQFAKAPGPRAGASFSLWDPQKAKPRRAALSPPAHGSGAGRPVARARSASPATRSLTLAKLEPELTDSTWLNMSEINVDTRALAEGPSERPPSQTADRRSLLRGGVACGRPDERPDKAVSGAGSSARFLEDALPRGRVPGATAKIHYQQVSWLVSWFGLIARRSYRVGVRSLDCHWAPPIK